MAVLLTVILGLSKAIVKLLVVAVVAFRFPLLLLELMFIAEVIVELPLLAGVVALAVAAAAVVDV